MHNATMDPNLLQPLSHWLEADDLPAFGAALDAGAPVTARAVVLSARSPDPAYVAALLGRDPEAARAWAQPQIAARLGHVETLRAMLEAGVDPNRGFALHFAVSRGHLDAVRLLLAHGADPNLSTGLSYESWDRTPLMQAMSLWNSVPWGVTADIVRALLDAGADPAQVLDSWVYWVWVPLRLAPAEVREMLLSARR